MNEDNELRLRIAKRLGYWVEEEPQSFQAFMYWVMTPEGVAVTTGAHTEKLAWELARANGLPDWPRDIAAAWTLLDDVVAAGGYYEVANAINHNNHKWCRIGFGEFNPYDDYFDEQYTDSGESDAIAISRAWLAWKEQQPAESGEGGEHE